MLEYYNILNCMDEILFEIIDSNNTIIYPKDENKLYNFEKIISNKKETNIIYNPNDKKWYEFYEKEINENYKIKYLLDISKYKDAEEKYKIDSLTSVLTRPIILEKINEELIDCFQNEIPFAIIIGDIDFFKDINDTYGHLIGDKVLKNLGKILVNQSTDSSKLVGRYGGEEFLLFFKNVTLQDTIETISKIKHSLDKLVIQHKEKGTSNVTMSFGIYYIKNLKDEHVLRNEKQRIIEGLINRADMALYKSKEEGRNQAHVYSDDGFIEKVEYK